VKDIFNFAIYSGWKTAGYDTQYWITERDDDVILSFQGSVSKQDWLHNFDFFAKAYKDQPITWFAHRGFLKLWKAVKDQILAEVKSVLKGRKLIITGYSHGAALAVLAHEFFNWHGLAPKTYAFGSPRVLWMPSKKIKERFADCLVIRRKGDIVTHIPPRLLGYQHPAILEIGQPAAISVERHFISDYFLNL
jgi:hypothetical protein